MPHDYSEFVEHPRYGRGPRITGLNPQTDFRRNTYIRHDYPTASRIPNTAIAADVARQTPRPLPITHYYDIASECRDCGRWFIFFAVEQKHWYEELGLSIDADCVRCVPCRKRQQGLAAKRQRYEELFHVANRTTDENIEMADCCLSLIESSEFGRRQLERVRMLLNVIRSANGESSNMRYDEILDRLRLVERSDG